MKKTKSNYYFRFKLFIFTLGLLIFGCYHEKKDLEYYETKAKESEIKRDFVKAENFYIEKVKLSEKNGWQDTRLFAVADVAQMKVFRRDFVGAEKLLMDEIQACKISKTCPEEALKRIVKLLFLIGLNYKKDINLINEVIYFLNDNDTKFLRLETKKVLLKDLVIDLSEAGFSSEAKEIDLIIKNMDQ